MVFNINSTAKAALLSSIIFFSHLNPLFADSDVDPECNAALRDLKAAQRDEDKIISNIEKENGKITKAQATNSKKVKALQEKKQKELDAIKGLSVLCKKEFPSLFKAGKLARPKTCADLLRPTITKIKKYDADIQAANTDFLQTKGQINTVILRFKKQLATAVKKRKAALVEAEDLGCEIEE